MITITNEDNMALMARYPDKYFDLAIVDPPYGIGASEMTMGKGMQKKWNKGKLWDVKPPDTDYFIELFRVSKNQIIWGGNYFNLPITGGWIYWNKQRGKDVSFSDGELAWTSFLSTLKQINCRYDGFIGADTNRIHPTQKPIRLYKSVLEKYAKCSVCEGSGEVPSNTIDCDVQTCRKCKGSTPKILDTHLGSGSIAIACHDYGFDLTACELDKDYYEAAMKRLTDHQSQLQIAI
jgi:site-specific DNA-methyltransferase (adenine-specific)